MKIRFKKMRPEATIPSFGHDDPSNAGLDLYLAESRRLDPGEDAWIGTGVAWEPVMLEDQGYAVFGWKPALLVRPRSSMAKRGLEITEGTVDSGYRGEIMVHVINRSKQSRDIQAGDRIAQAILVLLPSVGVEEVGDCEELSETVRGDKGFGSSGR